MNKDYDTTVETMYATYTNLHKYQSNLGSGVD